METLSGFDTVEGWIFNTAIAISFLWILYVLGSYTKEALAWYFTKYDPEPERAPAPDHVTHVFGLGILLVLWVVASAVASLYASHVQGVYDFAQKLSDNSEIVGKPLHEDVSLLIEDWPKIVKSYRASGNPGDFDATFDAYNEAIYYSFVDPTDYVSIKTFIKKCFVSNENLDQLEKVLSIYPVSQKAFVDEWIRASLRNDYSVDAQCSPQHIFIMTGVSKHVYRN